MSPHVLRLGLTPEPMGPRLGHTCTGACRVLGKHSHLGPYGPRQDLTHKGQMQGITSVPAGS